MRTPSKQEKELAIALAKIVNKVVPELVEKAGASTFEISLEKDEHGVGITIDLDYKEDMIHRGLTQEEMKAKLAELAMAKDYTKVSMIEFPDYVTAKCVENFRAKIFSRFSSGIFRT